MLEVSGQICLGDHAALFYEKRAEQLAYAIPYVKAGLARNERCLYIADDNSVPFILNRLEEAGIDVDEALKAGSLLVNTKRETYLRHGLFEPDRMIADLRKEVEISRRNGFSGFRATGEMTWALDIPLSLARLHEYEAKLHADFPEGFAGMCQYDETRFPSGVIAAMLELHSTIIRRGRLMRKERCASHPPVRRRASP